jgi:hypothetical protein
MESNIDRSYQANIPANTEDERQHSAQTAVEQRHLASIRAQLGIILNTQEEIQANPCLRPEAELAENLACLAQQLHQFRSSTQGWKDIHGKDLLLIRKANALLNQ